jgi:hypothetical protein
VGILEKISAASSSPDPNTSLGQLVKELAMQGFTRQEIYEMFYTIRLSLMYSQNWLALEERNNNHHPIDSIIDRLGGFCNPRYVLLPHQSFTNNNARKDYDRTIQFQDRPKAKRKNWLLTLSLHTVAP